GAAHGGQVGGGGVRGPGKNVFDQGRPGGRAVTLPQLIAVRPVFAAEQEHVARGRQLGEGRARLDHHRSGGGAVGLPQPGPVAVGGDEEQLAADGGGRRPGREAEVDPVAAARVDVLDHRGAGGRAVALPQLVAVDAVVAREVQRAAHGPEADDPERPDRVDRLDGGRAGGRAVGLPQRDPLPRGRGGGREVEGAVHVDLDLDVREVHGRDRYRAGGRAVALPQLRVGRVLRRPCGEEESIADGGQL